MAQEKIQFEPIAEPIKFEPIDETPEESTVGSLFKKAVAIANWPSERIASGIPPHDDGTPREILGPGMMEIPGISAATDKIQHAIDPTESPFYTGIRPFAAGAVKFLGETLASGFDPRTAGVKKLPNEAIVAARGKFKPKDIELPSTKIPDEIRAELDPNGQSNYIPEQRRYEINELENGKLGIVDNETGNVLHEADNPAELEVILNRIQPSKSGASATRKQFSIVEKQPSVDPNFNQGMGDPEMASSIPYKKESAFNKPKITADVAAKSLAEHGQMIPPAETVSPVKKLNQALKDAVPLNEEQAAIYTKERAEKISRAESITATGEEGARQKLAAMAGEHTKIQNAPLKLEQNDVDGLFDAISNNETLSAFEKQHARTGLYKLLDGKVPQPNEVTTLSKTFGPEFTESLATQAEMLRATGKITTGNKLVSEVVNVPRAILSTMDMSAPLRQGLGLIHKKEFWSSLDDMFKSAGSQKAYEAVWQSIHDTPTFGLSQNPSVGLRLTEFGKLSQQEEKLIGSRLIEFIPGVKGSNRAYVAFLNKLRMDTFDSLINSARALGHDPDTNYHLTKQIADFVNNATGRGSLGSWEKNAELLNNTFFSPRLIASRLQMLNPKNYLMTDPFVRKEYWKSLAAMTASGNTFLGLASLAGATVSLDSNSADFGKAKIGNTRFDPWGGFQQYGVLASRLVQGKSTPSGTKDKAAGQTYDLGGRFGVPTRGDVGKEFLKNKTNPIVKFAWDWFDATKNRPFEISNETKEMLIPFVIQDIMDTYQDNPNLLPLVVPAATFGMGTQTY